MTFFVLSDDPVEDRMVDALRARAGEISERHSSGRPRIVGTPGRGGHTVQAEGSAVTVRGTLSTTHHVWWARVGRAAVAASSACALRDVLRAPVDLARVALALSPNLPGSPLRLAPFWHGVHAASPGHAVRLEAGGRVSQERTWSVPSSPGVERPEAAQRVRGHLDRVLGALVAAHPTLGCDLSGGVDSTSLAYLLDATDADVTYTRSSTDDPANVDARWAARAAADLRGPLVELAPFGETSQAFDLDDDGHDDRHGHGGVGDGTGLGRRLDGPPAWGAHAGHLRRLFAHLAGRGATAHVNGLGGDELFSALPSALRSLRGEDPRAGRRAIARLVVAQRWPVVATWRAARDRQPFGVELVRRARTTADGVAGPADAFGWAPGFGVSRFATPWARDAVVAAVERHVENDPYDDDRGRHQLLDAVVFQGEVVRQVNAAFADRGIAWVAPLLDEALVLEVLGLPVRARVAGDLHKPLLAAATDGVVPREVFTRRDKGEYSRDLFRELAERRARLRALVDESYLVDTGLVDGDALRRALDAPMAQTAQVFELEHVVGVERWVRSVA